MARYLKIDEATGLVLNAEVWDGAPEHIDGVMWLQSEVGGPGWTYIGGEWTPPPEPEPPPPRREVVRKIVVNKRLEELGKLNAVWGILQAMPEVFGRWIHDGANLYTDDEELLAVLRHPAVGLAEEQIAAVTAPE